MARDRNGTTTPRPPRTRSDAYVGLLALALVAQMAGAAFLYLDYASYPSMTPPKLQSAPAGGTTQPPPPGGGQQQGGQQQGGQQQGVPPMPVPMQ
jgi:hypothetical protein